ncbi:SWIB/MDM2 domain protein [Cordyceps fumosorosea ARSEF 2679]|uniref:SWIB/MDM2 domain protein n=1 Tax=Cordyceps fumosorosea (strain ARSEF 2679) TaxID=1081104 RepID=A0A167TRP0_CORFA|nr:SWIB/MDM2 domain protein [Cordyceps fumosorosea ARSEF 2679]OAA60875.1 SWIB/MDM2 domain protein [Cordyceps fumosorosea ARSEF 2679]
MSAPLSSEERQQYTAIIDGILATADLQTITRKNIRQGLETSLGGKDLSEQKNAIKKLIEARFDAVSGANADDAPASPIPAPTPSKRSATNGNHDRYDSDVSAGSEPAKKKAKRSSSVEDADARLAAQLQAQENRLARGRTTRGGDKPRGTKKRAPKAKSSKRARDDDSDVDGSDAAPPKRKAGGGFQKPFNLSESLSVLCGETQLSRPQVVKKLWEHIKANDLQDPSDKRQILCDERMYAVFKQGKVDMFKMNKEIGNHLYPVGEE